MIVIVKNTEEKLLRELQRCKWENPSQRCFYITLSGVDFPRAELFERFLRSLQDIPDSYMAQVYICQDQDVFIFMKGFMQRQFMDFLNTFSEELEAPHLKDQSRVFEISVHWAELENMCLNKIKIINAKNEKELEKKRRKHAEQMAFETLAELDTGMIASIAQRREKRLQPLVLVVDDDQLSRTLAGNVLREDYDLAFARDGKSALREFVDQAPDVVFLDIGMPDISGHEVLEMLFQIDPEAYVIMFSGRKDQENMMRALETGAQGFLGKPFTREKLYRHVEQSPFIQKKKNRGRHYESATG